LFGTSKPSRFFNFCSFFLAPPNNGARQMTSLYPSCPSYSSSDFL
jgi:hypothetical protein